MCVAIPLGRRSDGPQGTRLGRYLRERPWRWAAAVPLLASPGLAALWILADPVPALLALLIVQGLAAAPLFGAVVTGLPAATRTSPPSHLWFALVAGIFLAGLASLMLGLAAGPVPDAGWATSGLLGLAWAWWLAARRLAWHLGWSRVRLPAVLRALPLATRLGALTLGLAALAVGLGSHGAWLLSACYSGLVLTAAVGLAGVALIPIPRRRTVRSAAATGHA